MPSDVINVQVRFDEPTAHGRFSDALYYTLEQWAKVTPEQLAAAKQARIDAWVTAITAPSVPDGMEPAPSEVGQVSK